MANLGYLQLTRNCYQRCRFCSNPPTGVDLSIQEMRDVIDGLAEMDYDGVILTGGEPTMSPLLKPALEYATDCQNAGGGPGAARGAPARALREPDGAAGDRSPAPEGSTAGGRKRLRDCIW